MSANPLLKLTGLGQSFWLDTLDRELIHSGNLANWIQRDGLRGLTSDPEVFQQSIYGGGGYGETIRSLAHRGQSAERLYETIALEDIKQAADLFRSTYDQTHGRDGFISLAVSPHVVHNTLATIEEARRLWASVNRPNLLIEVPATQRGLAAIQQLVREGLNVNAALIFGLPRYQKVAQSFMAGLQMRAAENKALDHVAAVASVFVRRIDVLMDPKLEKLAQTGGPRARLARRLVGQTAIASAKAAYQINKEIFSSERFRKLAEKGARTQRLLWAVGNTADPDDNDLKYVEALIGPDTVSTFRVQTLEAYRDHGRPAPRLLEDLEQAHQVLDDLVRLGFDLDEVAQDLEDEGVMRFKKAYDKVMVALDRGTATARSNPLFGGRPNHPP